MPMDVDTSSYPKPQQTNFLDTVGKLQGLEQNKIGIEQSKLNLVNNQYGILNKELNSLLADPNVTPDKIIQSSQNLVRMGLIPPDMHAKFIGQIPTTQQLQQDPNAVKTFLQRTLTRTMDTQQAINFHYGQPDAQNNGQQVQPGVSSPKFGFKAQGAPYQLQVPPTTQVATPGGTQLQGPTAPQAPPGVAPLPGSRPNALPVGPITNPAILGPSSNFGGTVTGATVEPPTNPLKTTQPTQTAQSGYPAPSGPMTSQPPLFDEGKKQLSEDQALATNKLTAIKPALQALPLMKELTLSGPLTDKIVHIGATLKNLGIIPTDTKNDKIAVQQEVIKKMYQYLSSNPVGQRSDASQTLAEAGSPNPNVQILPALIKLTKDAIALDRVQAARSGAFVDEKGNQRSDLHNYGLFRSGFPAAVDEKAFTLDMMDPKEKQELFDKYSKVDPKTGKRVSTNTFEANKFWKSLDIVNKQGLINTGGQ